MKHLFTFLILFSTITLFAQSDGDTIVVETFNYTQTHGWPWSGLIRDTMIDFPDDPEVTYEKIIMLYNMRCKDGLVSTIEERNKGCGEWDYSCNTYIHDSSKVDSVLNFTNSHSITAFSGTTFDYSETPTYVYNQYRQKDVQIDATNSETLYAIGSDDLTLSHVLPADEKSGKSQYLYRADELTTAGLTAGDIDALLIEIDNNSIAEYFKISLKQTDKTDLLASEPDLDGFSEVYFIDQPFNPGQNRIQFHTPFTWDGSSNIIVEFTFTNHNSSNNTDVKGEDAAFDCGIYAQNGFNLEFVNGKIELPTDPMSTISEEITVSFWSYGNEKVQPIHNSIIHAVDADNYRTLNMHLPWGNSNIYFDCGNDGSSYDRINKAASPEEFKGSWSHWAVTKNSVTGDMKIYHNGEAWHGGTEKVRLIDIYKFILGTSGTTNRSYFGKLDEIRIWDTELSQETIKDWMHKTINQDHPQYDNLVAYYRLNEGSGSTINDDSDFLESASIGGYTYWMYERGEQLNRDFYETQERPKLWFAQGEYELTITNLIVTDSSANIPNIVREYEIISRNGTMLHDSINELGVNEYWEANYQYIYDPEGILIDSVETAIDGTIEIEELEYFTRYPMKFEIMSFVTPYGIFIDFGMEGKTWAFDVTDYGPILKGSKRMTVERGGEWQEDMDIRFLFIVGTPPRDVIDIQQLWRADSKGYTSILQDRSFEPRDVPLSAEGEFFKIRTVITGHGQQGEFIGRNHFINIEGNEEFFWKVWTECAGNPIYPQGGTWIYDRAGWCPGQVSDLKENDITNLVTPGEKSNIDYGLQSASGASNYIVNNQLVTYGKANFENDAAVAEVLKPNSLDAKNDRFNPACTYPEIVIRNTGKTTLTSLEIEYYEQGGQALTYDWSGSLEFMEKETVVLPVDDLTFWLPTSNVFVAKVKNPNGQQDEYPYNNTYKAKFVGVDIYSEGNPIVIECKTNNYAYQNSYVLSDGAGNIIQEWTDLEANTVYSDPFSLDPGCYKLSIIDLGGDGLSFWAKPAQGTGHLKIKNFSGELLHEVNPDFGNFVEYDFGVGEITSSDELEKPIYVNAYPNPATDQIRIDIQGLDHKNFTIQLSNSLMATVYEKQGTINSDSFSTEINIRNLPSGVYILQIQYGNQKTIKKIVKR